MSERMQTPLAARARNDVRVAWWSLALYPVAFVLAFVATQAVPLWLGYDVATTEAPWWALFAGLGMAVLVAAVPLPVTVFFSRRASKHGDTGARTPLTLAIVGTGAVCAMFAFSTVAWALMQSA